MTQVTETPQSTRDKIDPAIVEIAERFKAATKIDDSTGVGLPPETSFYYQEGERRDLPKEMIDNVKQFDKDFANGVKLGFGELAANAMHKNEQLKETSMVMETSPDARIELYMPRESIGRNPRTGEPVTSHGRLTADWVTGMGDNRGQTGLILKHLRELGGSLLSNK